ncbi:hypothetical protein [Nocardia jejuensis]|uniref:hypothetical protein n=1 Tax=Nocardia jejuensis TaxID=328049 RepID=UPI000835C8D7|nr:hypothetical protein [Nocardia jejuensis]
MLFPVFSTAGPLAAVLWIRHQGGSGDGVVTAVLAGALSMSAVLLAAALVSFVAAWRAPAPAPT